MLKNSQIRTGLSLAAAGLLVTSMQSPALAHHMEDGQLLQTAGEGFLSGLAHPVIGLDHLAFIIAIGLLSLRWSRGLLMPLFILPAALIGTGLHLRGLSIPSIEITVALSVIALGALLVMARRRPLISICGLAAFCGLAHGYGFAEAILGAHRSAIGPYLLGFTLVQLTIALAVRRAALYLWKRAEARPAPTERIAGKGIRAVNVTYLLLGIKG